jgi:surface protein
MPTNLITRRTLHFLFFAILCSLSFFLIPASSFAACNINGVDFDEGGRTGSGVSTIDRGNPITLDEIKNWSSGDDVTTCDVSHLTDLTAAFINKSDFNQDIGSWDTSNVSTFHTIFSGASSFNQDIGSWDTGKVVSLFAAFISATAFNQNISGWNLSSNTRLRRTFMNATSFNQDISSWDTSNVSRMDDAFAFASAFNQNIRSWDTTSVTNYNNMFSNATAMISTYTGTSGFGTTPTSAFFNQPSNTAPVANAGTDQSVQHTQYVTLDGTSSSDADSDSLTYSWTQTSGTSVTLSSSTASQPTFTAPTLSFGDSNLSLVFSLVVNDGTEDSIADTVTITVASPANSSPVANAGPDQTVSAGATVTLDGTSSSDADGHSLSYAWTQTSGTSVTLSSSTASQPTFTAPIAANTTTLIFSLVVTDTESADSSADTVTITVNPLDPTVAFNNVKSEIDTLVNDAAFTAMQNHHQVTNTLSSAAVNRAMNNSCGTFKDQYYFNVNSNSDTSTAEGKITWSSIKDSSRYVKHQSIEFIHRDLEDGPNTSHLSFTLQWEDCTRDTFLWGYFAGAQAENSDLENSTFTDGEYNSTGLKVGSYFVKSLHQNAYWNGIISAPYNFNDMSLNTSLMHTSSHYETKMISAGTGLTGQIAYKFITFKPNVNLRYSSHHSERVKFIASVGSQQSDNFIDLDRLEQITLRLRPSFIFELNQSNPSYTPTTLIVDPELSCDQKVVGTNTQRCTQGISISFSQIFSNDVEFSLETGVQSNNDRNTHHFRTNIQIPF